VTLLLLTLAYVVVTLLLLNVGFRSHWRWQVKFITVFITAAFYIGTWYGLKHLQGWPLDESLPAEFRLISEYIEQPNKRKGTDGAIYLWVTNLAEDDDSRPRAYRLPYQEALHEDITEATARGRPQIGKRVGQGAANQPGEQVGSAIKFEDVPRAKLPTKH